MRNILLTLILSIIISSCKEKKESIPLENNVEINTTELAKTQIENKSITIDTTLLFNVWSADRTAPHADFLLDKDSYQTVEESHNYSLTKNIIEIQFPNSKLKGIINYLSKDTLKIMWNDDRLETTYLTYKNGYKFTREEILKTVNFYKENYGKETTSFDFVDYELDPKLYVLAKMVCDNKDEELLKSFLEMVLASKGSASETPSDIFSEVYFCNPDLMIDYLTNKYKDEYLRGQLEFGFENATYGVENETKNYKKLKAEIEKLLK